MPLSFPQEHPKLPVIALVTASAARGLDEDLPLLEAALRREGADVHSVDWDGEVDWARFDVAVLRSTWDYAQRLGAFLAWAERASASTRLLNALPVIRWNTDKHYLIELAARGVPVVPSEFVEPGQSAAQAITAFFSSHDAAELVVKPAIGAGSRDTQRYARAEHSAATLHAQRLVDAGRSALLQPYLASVDELGETALLYFGGRFSHAIRKGPLLRRGEGPTRALFAAEHISAREPSPDELSVAGQALAAVPFGALPYARVDLIRDADGAPRLLELELTEPSVFLSYAAGSAERFAKAVLG